MTSIYSFHLHHKFIFRLVVINQHHGVYVLVLHLTARGPAALNTRLTE